MVSSHRGRDGRTHVANLATNQSRCSHATVSAAAGAVGQIVVQLAKAAGLKVIASAGDTQKVAFLKDELKADVVWNYKEEDAAKVLAEHPFEI